MKDQSSANLKLQQRRRFITSAVVGGTGSLFACTAIARAAEAGGAEACGELTAADPLYLYQTLVPRLQVSAIAVIHAREGEAEKSLSDQIDDLYELSTKLKAKLPHQSKLKPAVERLNSLAYIGHTNRLAAKAGSKFQSRDLAWAHAKSQRVITAEIVKAAVELPAQPGVTLSDEAWSILQELLTKIDDINKVYQPAVEQAHQTFDEDLKKINARVMSIQAALMSASSSVVRGDKAGAVGQVDFALRELAKLPAPTALTATAPVTTVDSDPANGTGEAPEITRDRFIELLTPVKDLINGTQRVPRISTRRSNNFSLTPVGFVSPSEIILPNARVDPSGVREIVQNYIPSGTWWQVVGVTAACLPLWAAYSQSEHRKSLIYSALTAVPRGHSRLLWQAAYYLNRLTA